jgi:hypothetical protein
MKKMNDYKDKGYVPAMAVISIWFAQSLLQSFLLKDLAEYSYPTVQISGFIL